ncbi:GUN4 domain-containing protein [Pannus brasiliensis CCIBt3594]|uniref:GUN4 domain-containing protein n=1 Tax=Pannus brasiliensis CCIBt3594 TaxID=1427578 RepID=A0AAW9QTA3_9CHRO
MTEIELKSIKGIDYTKLQDLLKQQQWKEADKETERVMLQVANRTEEGWLEAEDIDNFPCEDLRTIDQLWMKYSNGRFGFSVQAKIYCELGGTREYNEEIWNAFGDEVGWRVNNSWIYYYSYSGYSEVTFDLKAPQGHLPSDIWCGGEYSAGFQVEGLWVEGEMGKRRWLGGCWVEGFGRKVSGEVRGGGKVRNLFSRVETCEM